jgi:hypothetical protein
LHSKRKSSIFFLEQTQNAESNQQPKKRKNYAGDPCQRTITATKNPHPWPQEREAQESCVRERPESSRERSVQLNKKRILIFYMITPKISGHGHVLILTDGACVDGRIYLQKRETMKECTGGGSMGEPPIIKSNDCYLNSNIRDKSIEVRKRECTLIQEALRFI